MSILNGNTKPRLKPPSIPKSQSMSCIDERKKKDLIWRFWQTEINNKIISLTKIFLKSVFEIAYSL
jgi:hypothetical protein